MARGTFCLVAVLTASWRFNFELLHVISDITLSTWQRNVVVCVCVYEYIQEFFCIQVALCVHCNNTMCVVIMAGTLELKWFLCENLESGEKGAR